MARDKNAAALFLGSNDYTRALRATGDLQAGMQLGKAIAAAGQAELAARVLPRLAGAVPMKAKLRKRLADGGRGLLTE